MVPGNRRRKVLRKRKQLLRRRDIVTRMLVDLGVQYLDSLGLHKASEFLRRQNVPDNVIVRVLQFPQLRRRY